MPESGGSSQSSRSSQSGLFKRRRQPSRSRNVPASGDICQIAADSATAKNGQKGFSLWGWFAGKRSRRQPRAHQRNGNLASTVIERQSASATGDRRAGAISQFGQTNFPKNRNLTSNSQSFSTYDQRDRRQSTSGISQSNRRLPSLNDRSQYSSLNNSSQRPSDRFTSQPLSRSRVSDSPSIIPLPQRRGHTEARSQVTSLSRRPKTRLQANQPTLIQASTSLQQSTLLQGQKTSLKDGRRSTRLRKPEEAPARPQSRSLAIALYAARMVILSVGVGVLAGTVLSAWNPANNPFFGDSGSQSIKQASSVGKTAPVQPATDSNQLVLTQELASLKTAVQGVAQQYPGFTPGVFLIDLDNNNFVDWGGSASFAAASTIKVPVLIAFFQEVDAGRIRLDEKLIMRKDLIATESGDMQYLPPGAQFTALETATKMITISDNTATNMLIDRLGGIQAVNQRFKSWGLSATQITSLLPDLKGTNTTSPKELASLMVRVSQGELVSLRSRDRLLDIMRRTVNNSQLPQGLGEGATIAHKTGDIGTLIGDVGLVDMPSGKRYATAVLVKRAFNDDRAYDLVQKISRAMYQHFVQPATLQKRPVAPTPTTPLIPKLEPEETNTDAQYIPEDAPNTPERTIEQPATVQATSPY